MFGAVLQALVNGLFAGALLAIPALGFSAIFAVLRFPNFAIGALATAGAYVAWIANVTFGLPIVAAIVVAFVSAAIFGAALEYGALERLGRGGALMKAIGSLAMAMVIENVVRFYEGGGGHGMGVRGVTQTLPTDSLHLSNAERDAIVAFMKTLTDTVGTSARPHQP